MIIDWALVMFALFCIGALVIRHLPGPAAPPKNRIGFH
jgi:hypothetical protein